MSLGENCVHNNVVQILWLKIFKLTCKLRLVVNLVKRLNGMMESIGWKKLLFLLPESGFYLIIEMSWNAQYMFLTMYSIKSIKVVISWYILTVASQVWDWFFLASLQDTSRARVFLCRWIEHRITTQDVRCDK